VESRDLGHAHRTGLSAAQNVVRPMQRAEPDATLMPTASFQQFRRSRPQTRARAEICRVPSTVRLGLQWPLKARSHAQVHEFCKDRETVILRVCFNGGMVPAHFRGDAEIGHRKGSIVIVLTWPPVIALRWHCVWPPRFRLLSQSPASPYAVG
jgi:hypothetical protein